MPKRLWSIGFTLLFAAMSVYFLAPTFNLYKIKDPVQREELLETNPDLRKKVLNLGLDLTGGMRLLLEVERNETNKDDQYLLDRAYTVIENRVNGSGISEAVVQKQGDSRLVIELPGLNDEEYARQMIGSQAQLQFHLVRSPEEMQKGLMALDKALRKVDPTSEIKEEASLSSNDSLDTPVVDTTSNVSDEEAELLAEMGLTDEVTSDDTTAADDGEMSILQQYLIPAQEFGTYMISKENRKTVKEMLEDSAVVSNLKQAGLGSSKFLIGATLELAESIGKEGYLLYFVKAKPAMNGKEIEAASPGVDQQNGGNNVSLAFSNDGAKEFHKVTAQNVGEKLAIVLDGYVYSAPNINEPIAHGNASISGAFSFEEANGLAVVLQAGAMPAPVEIIEVRSVGPTLGVESIRRAAWAALIGFGLVVAFMVYYYKGSGIIAITALALNLIFVLAIMAGAGATLTLPGIAGLILIIGMSIDANVIIFERIKEELLLGKGINSSIDAGYDRAAVTIMDANLTTLATAWILYEVGTGPIRGFAVTMSIGILVSLFTALIFTKTLFHLFTDSGKIKNLSIFPVGHKGK